MSVLTGILIGGVVGFALMFMVAVTAKRRSGDDGCGNHHFEEYTPTGHLRVVRTNGSKCYLDVEKKAICEHEGCSQSDVEWDRHGKVAEYPSKLPEYLGLVEEGLW